MFNLEDFDFDDDFTSNVFNKRLEVQPKNAIHELAPTPCQKTKSPESLFNFSLKESSSSNLKRPFVEDSKPQKKRFSHEGLVQRKFPGPAGLLPDKPFREISDVSLLIDKPKNEEKEKCVYSQSSGSVFLESGYQKLIADFNLNESNNPLNKYTVEWVKKTALNKGFQGKKIPFLGLVVHSLDNNSADPVVHLRDQTGEINGTLHREVWADLGGKLRSGIALALRQVGVLITGVIRRQIYLNITMNNILAIYTPSENENQVEITTINKISREELNKSFEQWLSKPKPKPSKAPIDLQPFTTVNDLKLNNLTNKSDCSKKDSSELASLGIVLSDDDFSEEIMPAGSEKGGREVLSQEESAIFEEVLSGIDLDEFEM